MGFLDSIFSKKIGNHIENGSAFSQPEIKKGRIGGIEVDYFTVEDEYGNETLVLKNVYSEEPGAIFKIIGSPLEKF